MLALFADASDDTILQLSADPAQAQRALLPAIAYEGTFTRGVQRVDENYEFDAPVCSLRTNRAHRMRGSMRGRYNLLDSGAKVSCISNSGGSTAAYWGSLRVGQSDPSHSAPACRLRSWQHPRACYSSHHREPGGHHSAKRPHLTHVMSRARAPQACARVLLFVSPPPRCAGVAQAPPRASRPVYYE
jgi:hypothetical protein